MAVQKFTAIESSPQLISNTDVELDGIQFSIYMSMEENNVTFAIDREFKDTVVTLYHDRWYSSKYILQTMKKDGTRVGIPNEFWASSMSQAMVMILNHTCDTQNKLSALLDQLKDQLEKLWDGYLEGWATGKFLPFMRSCPGSCQLRWS